MPPKRYFDDRGSTSASKVDDNDNSTIIDDSVEIGNESTSSSRINAKRQRKKESTTPHVQTTLFISSIPFTATSTDLQTLFSDIGPLRRAFVVTEKETGKSKGVGYVTFAIHEDAKRAIEQMQGHSLDGKRKMRIEWATGRFGEAAVTESSETKHEKGTNESTQKTSSSTDRDPDAVRTIIMTGLGECKPKADNKSIYKRARKIGDVENVIYPAPSSIVSTDLSDDVAHVVYRTPNHAMTAVTKLHAHVFKGAQVSVVLKKRADGAAKLDAHMRPETKAKRDALKKKVEEEQKIVKIQQKESNDLKPEVNRGSRLIIRNLPFDVTDRDLRAIFLPFGPIYSIDVPQKATSTHQGSTKAAEETITEVEIEDETGEEQHEEKKEVDEAAEQSKTNLKSKSQGRGRGFAFVWHVSRNDAANAINGLNGTSIGHGAAEKAQLKAAKGKAGREAAKKALEEVMQSAQPAREVAVDWALSKKEWELKKDESEAGDTDVEGLDEDDDDEDNEDEEDDDDENEDADEDEDEDENEDEDEDEDEESEDAKPSLPKPEEGTTLFIRNLPYQATEEELKNLFRSFGPLRYAKLTMDKITKRPKGTAFICFWQKESAEKALQQSRLVEQEAGTASTNNSNKKKVNPFSASSILTADPSAPLTASLSLHGRVLSIVEAVERTTADELANASQNARNKSDKRNTYLMREGVPMPGTPLAERLNEVEIDRRLANFQMRKTQLTKNPSLYISKTRLSVRQLPLFVTDKVLKKLAEYSVKKFDEQVEAGERQDLTTDELQESRKLAMEMQRNENAIKANQDRQDGDDDEGDDESKSKKQQLKLKRQSALNRRRMTNKGGFVVVQSKVIRAKDRLDATLGLGRSHGYGFIEMVTFADALKCVRFANANSSLRKLMINWYKDELKEILQKMKKESTTSAETSSNKKKDDEFVARMKRIERKISSLEAGQIDVEEEGTRGGLLVAEFSVENIVTVKRRSERVRGGGNKMKNGRDRHSNKDEGSAVGTSNGRSRLGKRGRNHDETDQSGPSNKKPRRPATWNQKTKKGSTKQPFVQPTQTDNGYGDRSKRAEISKEAAPSKQGSLVGSIIGRKRKMRQGNK